MMLTMNYVDYVERVKVRMNPLQASYTPKIIGRRTSLLLKYVQYHEDYKNEKLDFYFFNSLEK